MTLTTRAAAEAASAASAAPPPEARRRRRRFRRGALTPYLFIGGGSIFLILFAGIPVLKGIDLSFTDTKLLNPSGGSYIGLDNYARLMSSEVFLGSVVTTIVYTVATVVLSLTVGTVAAVIINRSFPGRTFSRAVLIIPWAVPTVAVALVFRWIFNDSSGVANAALGVLGFGSVGWLTDPEAGMISVLIATVWKVSPFVMLVVLAALQSVPDDLHEAAKIDGADPYSTFKSIVIPHIAPTLKIVALLMTIWSFRRFEIIWLLTGGGPADATTTIVINVYKQAFVNSQLGYAAAAGVLGLLLSLCVTFVYFAVEARNERAERKSS